jgi:DnaK suppressor protein
VGKLGGWAGVERPGPFAAEAAPRGPVGPCPSESEPMTAGRMTDRQREELRELLLSEREAARRRLASLARTFDEMVDAADLEPPDDEHDPEGTTAYERAQVSSLAGEAKARLEQVERALHELDRGRYGDCERCGAAIGWERLQARPGTATCVGCAANA